MYRCPKCGCTGYVKLNKGFSGKNEVLVCNRCGSIVPAKDSGDTKAGEK